MAKKKMSALVLPRGPTDNDVMTPRQASLMTGIGMPSIVHWIQQGWLLPAADTGRIARDRDGRDAVYPLIRLSHLKVVAASRGRSVTIRV